MNSFFNLTCFCELKSELFSQGCRRYFVIPRSLAYDLIAINYWGLLWLEIRIDWQVRFPYFFSLSLFSCKCYFHLACFKICRSLLKFEIFWQSGVLVYNFFRWTHPIFVKLKLLISFSHSFNTLACFLKVEIWLRFVFWKLQLRNCSKVDATWFVWYVISILQNKESVRLTRSSYLIKRMLLHLRSKHEVYSFEKVSPIFFIQSLKASIVLWSIATLKLIQLHL